MSDSEGWYLSETHRVRCPEGTVFVTFDESGAGLERISAKIGKGDYTSHAHLDGITRMASAAVRAGSPVGDLALELRGISREGATVGDEAMSVADAVAIAMLKYTGEWEE